MTVYTIHKHDHNGVPVWQYHGTLDLQTANTVCVHAHFGTLKGRDVDIDVVTFRVGDLMTEWFYSDRWYNVFQIDDVDHGHVKGWYCNISRPAMFYADYLTHDDLALDVFVRPDGTIDLLDEDEFALIDISDTERRTAWDAVAQIREAVTVRAAPFDVIK